MRHARVVQTHSYNVHLCRDGGVKLDKKVADALFALIGAVTHEVPELDREVVRGLSNRECGRYMMACDLKRQAEDIRYTMNVQREMRGGDCNGSAVPVWQWLLLIFAVFVGAPIVVSAVGWL